MKNNLYRIYFLILLFAVSCKPIELITADRSDSDFKKIVVEAIDYRSIPSNVLVNNMNFQYNSDKNIAARITFYSELDNCVFASVRYLGFEVFRIGVFMDSVKFINRFQREYYFESINKINNLPLDPSLKIIQPFVLTGFYYNQSIKKKDFLRKFVVEDNSLVVYDDSVPGRKILFYYNRTTGKLDKLIISDYSSVLNLEALFDYRNNELNKISGIINRNGDKADFELTNIDIQKKAYNNTEFNIGKNYKKLENVF